jgi:deoxyhypusine synthase
MSSPVGREISEGHRVVAASAIPENPIRCPHCLSSSFVLQGLYKRTFEQAYHEGEVIEEQLVLSPKSIQEITGLICAGCGIVTHIQDDTIFERESMIFDLQIQIAIMQGRVGSLPTSEWKN